MKRRLRTYLFHGEAVKIIVLAMIADILTARGIEDVEVLRVKGAAETLQQFNSIHAVERTSGSLCVSYCSHDLLDHLGGSLLKLLSRCYPTV